MYSKLPLIPEPDEKFWQKYNQTHMQEHQDMANWISALAKAHNLGIEVSYYTLPVFIPNQIETVKNFFAVNYKQHMIYYDFLNSIGSKLEIPVFVFPRNYPSHLFDMNIEYMLKTEKEIHNTLFRAINIMTGEIV